jgi:serine protease Do
LIAEKSSKEDYPMNTLLRIFILITLLSLLVSGCNTTSSFTSIPTTTPIATAQPTATPGQLSFLPSIADVVAKVLPSVVYISVEYKQTSFFFQTISTKSGSGVILSADGYILTNNHVIEDATKIEVSLPSSDETYQARIIGTDPLSDLGVIKIDGQSFPSAEFGNPSMLRVGDWVIALGNPLGLEGGPSVTLGIVSNLERTFTIGSSAYYDVIQTDAAINPGNSGGPLIDLEGKVVGINTFIISGAENIGFAVGTNTARRVYNNLIEYGRVIRPYLGVTLRDVTTTVASQLGLAKDKGALVWYVAADSPAAKAGLKVNDVITQFQGQKINDASHLIKYMWEYQVGDTVELTFWRGKTEQKISVTLTERP